jgi:polysaccharide pyruvyl transferase WcaK-like protein
VTAVAELTAPLVRASKTADRPLAPRIGVLYPSGAGNLGDEAILQATFKAIRQRWPNAQVRAFTLHPARTAANHGVSAEALTGINRHLFGAPRTDGPTPVRVMWSVARRTRRVPIVRNVTAWASSWTSAVVFEAMSLRRAWRWLQDADLLLAAGGGQLDAVWGGAWGQPYALARWSWLARRAGVPFAFLSVGYGGAPGRMSKRLLKYAVSASAYCSVRDAGSRALTKQLGVASDLPIVPDLAFALPTGSARTPRRPGFDIGLSPMVYLRPGSWPAENRAEYERYTKLWADLVRDRVARGDRVHLFVTDPADMSAVEDVLSRLDDKTRQSCDIAQASTPDALLEFFGGLDVVVSSRLHGVLLSIVAARPVMALSHERKVRAVMSDARVSEYCADLSTTSLNEVTQRLEELTKVLEPYSSRLADYVASARKSVREQEDLLPQLMRSR